MQFFSRGFCFALPLLVSSRQTSRVLVNARITPNGSARFSHACVRALSVTTTDSVARAHTHARSLTHVAFFSGRDCTELFESEHSLANLDVHAYLAKYEVVPSAAEAPQSSSNSSSKSSESSSLTAPDDMFTWEPNGFYATLVRRVRRHFAVNPQEKDDAKM